MQIINPFHFKSKGLPLLYKGAILKKFNKKKKNIAIKKVVIEKYITQSYQVRNTVKPICKFAL